MRQPRFRAASFISRAALLALLITAAVPAFSFPAQAAPEAALPTLSDGGAGADDLGLGIGPIYSANEPLFTIFYNATSYGEMQPCPT